MSNSTKHFGKEFEAKLRQAGGYIFDDDEDETWHIQPCSDQEISEIEQSNQVKLPRIYKEFLSTMGRNPGDFFRSELYGYPELLRLKQSATEILEDSGTTFRLAPSHFVIWMHGGYMFCYFDTASGADDPPVYFFREKYKEPIKLSDTYSDWMEKQLQDSIKVRG